jgi:8-oxo-dGTP diphosphatase
MPIEEQGIDRKRYQVIPRVLIFLFQKEKILLIHGSPIKPIWPGKLNGIGGHVERGEDLHAAAKRELYEETGLIIDHLPHIGSVIMDVEDDLGIIIFVFRGDFSGGKIVPSKEGDLSWVNIDDLDRLPVVEDLPILINKILSMDENDSPFSARSYYDENGKLVVEFG